MATRIITVKAKSPFLASSKFFGKKDLGRPIKPTKVKPVIKHKLFDVTVKF